MKTYGNYTTINQTSGFLNTSPYDDALGIKITNDYFEDLLLGKQRGKNTGFTGGYVSDTSLTYSYLLPGNPTSLTLPPVGVGTGASTISMASTSTQDSATGSGVSTFYVSMLNTNLDPMFEIVNLNGTTPVNLSSTGVYHFQYAFAIAAGSNYNQNVVSSNVGTVYIGTGSFNTSTGFSTNYMWNRPGDGFLSSTVYVCPRGKKAQLREVKFNGDRTVSVSFKSYGRASRTTPWSLGSEDTVNTGITIKRSLTGGLIPAGGEYTVVAAKTQNTSNIAANFVITVLEIDAELDNTQQSL